MAPASLVILCIHRKVFWWTGRCCLYPLRDVWWDGLVRVRCDSMVMQTTVYLSSVSGVIPTQHSLILGAGPYCVLTVQDQRSLSRTSTVGNLSQTYRQVLVATTCLEWTMREELPGLHWMVPLCNGIKLWSQPPSLWLSR